MWLEKTDCKYWRDELQCEIHWDTTHRCRNCASYKQKGDDIMNYDIFVKECKIQDAKIEGLTEEVERRNKLYKEYLDEIGCPYEDVYVSLYNGLAKNCGRVNIKSTFSKDEDGNWINETGEVLMRKNPYIFDGYIPHEPNTPWWISVPDFI